MLTKFYKFLGIKVNETPVEELNMKKLKSFTGFVLEKRDNELIIGSDSDKNQKIRLLLTEKLFLPNMAYPSLCDKAERYIDIEQISIRDKVILEFDNELKWNINVPANSNNTYLRLMDVDIKERIEK